VDSGGSALAIESDGLTKRFRGGQVAVDQVALRVPAGAVYGFLGPNGSGKTTTIRILLGLIFPTSGTHRLLGEPFTENAGRVLPRVGSLVEGPAFHPYLSGHANLARLDAADRSVDPRTARRRIGSASIGWDSPPPPASGIATTRSACGSGSASPPPSSVPAICSSWTSRPTA